MARSKRMWFGTRGYMQWVAAPDVSMPSSTSGLSQKLSFRNGGKKIRRSTAAAKEYTLTWTMVNREEIRPVLDYSDGVYGSGPVYFADPFAMDTNMLPQHWATPAQAGTDGIILDNSSTRPQLIPTDANAYGYPAQSAVFNVTPPAVGKEIYEVYVPIPPNYTAWIGAHGSDGTGGTVVCTPSIGATTAGVPVTLTLLPVTTATRFNHSVTSSEGNGVLIKLGGSGTITLSGLMVQVLPTGVVPALGGFISGQGNSGCTFDGNPAYTPYNAALNRVGLIAELTETESWRFTPNI